METLEAVKHSKMTLEAQLNTQRSLIESMRSELAGAKVHRACYAAVAWKQPQSSCIGLRFRQGSGTCMVQT
jgi:hypothetical protein